MVCVNEIHSYTKFSLKIFLSLKFKIFYEDKDLDDFEEEVIADCPEEDTEKEKEKTKNENV